VTLLWYKILERTPRFFLLSEIEDGVLPSSLVLRVCPGFGRVNALIFLLLRSRIDLVSSNARLSFFLLQLGDAVSCSIFFSPFFL